MWANDPSLDETINEILTELIPGNIDTAKFKYCGVEIEQSPEDLSVRITCKASIAKLAPIDISKGRARQPDEPCTEEEQSELWSVTGSLMWISRSCWPRIAYGVSALQSIVQKPLVRDLARGDLS